MSRMLHTSLAGKLVVQQDKDRFILTIDGFNVVDELLQLDGMEVQLEAVAYDKAPPTPPETPPADDIVQKLMGGD